ncbi:HORMA domain-containing protein 1-like [Ambystoma mexicanum]|uniref:HORMA domain-containing protein 1-like n=1 Tax=Ambystoma mexicanum TaxID=8296 RepID=UPI0037E7233A
MAVLQKLRTENKQETCGWAVLFPIEIKTQQQSVVFVKRMMAVAVSCITYLRGIFPEDAYRTRYLEELCLKILREDSKHPRAAKIVKWMKGCFDALEKKYLHMMIIGVHMNPDEPNKFIESYQFKFRYTQNGPLMDIASNEKEIITNYSTEDIKKASITLIRKLFLLMHNLGSLPNNALLTMKLFYYDDVTPASYQPPGFKEGMSESMEFEGIPVHVKVADVETSFHMLKIRVTTEQGRMEFMNKQGILKEEQAKINQATEPATAGPASLAPNIQSAEKGSDCVEGDIEDTQQDFLERKKEENLVAKIADEPTDSKRVTRSRAATGKKAHPGVAQTKQEALKKKRKKEL